MAVGTEDAHTRPDTTGDSSIAAGAKAPKKYAKGIILGKDGKP